MHRCDCAHAYRCSNAIDAILYVHTDGIIYKLMAAVVHMCIDAVISNYIDSIVDMYIDIVTNIGAIVHIYIYVIICK